MEQLDRPVWRNGRESPPTSRLSVQLRQVWRLVPAQIRRRTGVRPCSCPGRDIPVRGEDGEWYGSPHNTHVAAKLQSLQADGRRDRDRRRQTDRAAWRTNRFCVQTWQSSSRERAAEECTSKVSLTCTTVNLPPSRMKALKAQKAIKKSLVACASWPARCRWQS